MLAAHLLAQCSGRHRRGARDQHHRHHGAPIFAFCDPPASVSCPCCGRSASCGCISPGSTQTSPGQWSRRSSPPARSTGEL